MENEGLASFFDKNNLTNTIQENSTLILEENLKQRIIAMSNDGDLHSKYLAYHIILTLKKYKKMMSNE